MRTSPAGLDLVDVTITTQDGKKHVFTSEVARTLEQQSRGLMFRQSLEPNEAMIFLYPAPDLLGFWMKNTYIPLDIVFIREDGTIARIEEQALPMSLQPISSQEPAVAALEIPGGRSAELGIQPGDMVRWDD
ncbi:DUF192 domain-containing protein [Sphingomicrobium nitratireducens]|uniref:DUF192 domain-containing protein n=1 Tax=Sphingomicrobium nitratireducens TaxID=2964666 RepID=UPI00223F6E7C